MNPCEHETIIRGMCRECGAEFSTEESPEYDGKWLNAKMLIPHEFVGGESECMICRYDRSHVRHTSYREA